MLIKWKLYIFLIYKKKFIQKIQVNKRTRLEQGLKPKFLRLGLDALGFGMSSYFSFDNFHKWSPYDWLKLKFY